MNVPVFVPAPASAGTFGVLPLCLLMGRAQHSEFVSIEWRRWASAVHTSWTDMTAAQRQKRAREKMGKEKIN